MEEVEIRKVEEKPSKMWEERVQKGSGDGPRAGSADSELEELKCTTRGSWPGREQRGLAGRQAGASCRTSAIKFKFSLTFGERKSHFH